MPSFPSATGSIPYAQRSSVSGQPASCVSSPSRATCWIVSAWKTATSWASAPEGKILKTDVAVAKNYLTKDELDSLGRIVNAYLELAEDRAQRKIPMSMEDWSKRLDAFLEFDEREVLQNSGKISAKLAQTHAESEFEKYRIVQDRLFESDFDKAVKKLAAGEPNTRDDG